MENDMTYNPVVADMAVNVMRRHNPSACEMELELFRAVVGGRVGVVYFTDGPFTTAVLTGFNKSSSVLGAGSSKRNAADQYLPIRGKALALSRALYTWFTAHKFDINNIQSHLAD